MSEGWRRLHSPGVGAEHLIETANVWYDRWRSGLLNPGEAEAFRRWLDLDVSHRRAFEFVASVVSILEAPVTI